MDAAAFEQVYQDFQDFHAYFAPLFGRRETRDTAAIISGPCWCSPGSGAMPRISPNQWECRPGPCSGLSPILPGTMQRL